MTQPVKAKIYTHIDNNTVKLAVGDLEAFRYPPGFLRLTGLQRILHDLRPRLMAMMQTTLDLEELLSIFYEEINQVVTIKTIYYQHDREDITILNSKDGQEGPQTVSFQLQTSGDQVGIIRFSRTIKFKQKEIEFLEEISKALIYPARNALRYQEALHSAMTDSLTQVGNRLAFDNALQKEIDITSRYQQLLSVLLIDLDHFKKINDQFGHAVGDAVLKKVASTLSSICRQADSTFRFGGEEFTMILTNTCLNGAAIFAERIRKKIEAIEYQVEGQSIPISISIGVACFQMPEKREAFIHRADAALYQAKASGRNQVVISEPDSLDEDL